MQRLNLQEQFRRGNAEQRDNQDDNPWPRRVDIGRVFCRGQGFFCLIVAERQSAFWAALWLRILGSPPAIAFHIHLEDGGMVDEPVDGSERHCGIWKDRVPCPEWLVCGDQC